MQLIRSLAPRSVGSVVLVPVIVVLAAIPAALRPASAQDVRVSLAMGNLVPAGPPSSRVAVDAGTSCVIDIVLPYIVTGTLAGTAEIDYRIDVEGPCGEAIPGKFDETWIAHGTFSGSPGNAGFVYTADVKAGGKVKGKIVLGQGLTGWLWISGNLADAQLDYRGFIR